MILPINFGDNLNSRKTFFTYASNRKPNFGDAPDRESDFGDAPDRESDIPTYGISGTRF